MYRCPKCSQPWDDQRAQDNELTCTRRCGGQLELVEPLGLPDLEGCAFSRLPYPVALTGHRLAAALQASGDVLKTLFLLKDCFEATIKYLGAILLAEYRRSPACTTEHSEVLLKSMVRPSLGTWVSDVARPLSLWLIGEQEPPGSLVAGLFAEPGAKPGSRPGEAALLQRCKQFVNYRNDALGHGAQRRDSVYEQDLAQWLPLVRQLLDGVAGLGAWRLCLVTATDRCQVWLGAQPGSATEPGSFAGKEIGHFVLRGSGSESRDLYPFLCYLPDSQQAERLHYYDSLYRYQATKKEATVLEYDNGERHPRPEPITGMEEAFTAELLGQAFKWHRGRMEVIEGRVANFGELIEAHAAIVGRRFVIDHVRAFLTRHDRGLLVIEAQPGKGKTALMAHLIEEVFGQHAPRPVHFFYRRTAGITDPNVCVRSLYAALLEAHGIIEAEESKKKNLPEEVYIKLTNLLSQDIAPRLLPERPQLLFIDALDEATGNAFQRIPENLPEGVYIIATTRPVSDRIALARRQNLYWYDLDAPDLLQENLRDGFEYVQREQIGIELPNETLAEIARIGAGNFLVLKLLCQHLRTTLPPDQVSAFLRHLATDCGKDQLGFIYAEFWQRLTERCTRDEVNLLCDVAGLLVTANAPLTADMVCGVLNLRAGDWDFALRHLAEYFTAIEAEEDNVRVTFYRIYHESFADSLRAKVATAHERFCNRLADYCLRWSQFPEGYSRTYALRFGPRHLLEAERSNEAAVLLLDLFFLEGKTLAEMVFDLVGDLNVVAARLNKEDHRCRWLGLIEEAIRRDIHFIARHPSALFQCLWNSCWWYDCSEAANHYVFLVSSLPYGVTPWKEQEHPLSTLLEAWRSAKEKAKPCYKWLRLLRPMGEPLGTALKAIFRGHEGIVWSVAFFPDGRRLVSGSADGTVRVWDLASGAEILCLAGQSGMVWGVAVSSDGFRLASVSSGMVHIWEAAKGTLLLQFPGTGGRGVAFSPDGRRITDGSHVWDASSGVKLISLQRTGAGGKQVTYSPDGCHIAGGEGSNVCVWDASTGAQHLRLSGHEGGVLSVCYSPDGQHLASGSFDKSVRVWEAATGNPLFCLQEHAAGVYSICYSPDGKHLASGSPDQTVRIWDTRSGIQVLCLQGHDNIVNSVCYSPDGKHIASGSGSLDPTNNTVRIWDAGPHVQTLRLIGHGGRVRKLAFSFDGKRAVSTSRDQTLRVWEVLTGVQLLCLQEQEAIESVAFSADGQRIISRNVGGAERVRDASTGEEAEFGQDLRVIGTFSAAPVSPWVVLASGLETVVEKEGTKESIAWFPVALSDIVAHPSGRIWAGGFGNQICLFILEGV